MKEHSVDIAPVLEQGGPAKASKLRMWLVFLAGFGAAAVLIAALQRVELAFATPVTGAPLAVPAAHDRSHPTPRIAFAPTFADAAGSLSAGRHAEAYGRFVALADDGNVDAGRIALVMHRFGPELFGSAWDASPEQLAQWTRWSELVAQQESMREVARASDTSGRSPR